MDEERAIINKILSAGSPLSDWKVIVHCGIGAEYRKTFVMDDASDDGKYVCAVLNSTLARWFALHTPYAECSKTLSIEDMPIPKIGLVAQREIVDFVDEILADKTADPQADTFYLEIAINDRVYEMYGLTEEEDTMIERSLGLIHQTDEEEDAALLRAMEEVADEETVGFEEVEKILSEWDEDRDEVRLHPRHEANKKCEYTAQSGTQTYGTEKCVEHQ